jgi:transcriptional regulator with XRE-family HTH domain
MNVEPGSEGAALPAGRLTEAEAAGLLAALGARIADGSDATAERLRLIRRLKGEGWTQEAIAAAAGISQPAVSKALRTTPGLLALEEEGSGPYLIGRMIGLATHLSSRYEGLSCERQADKLARGALPPHPVVIGHLEQALERDLRRKGIPAAYRTAYDDIRYRLAGLAGLPPLPWPLADRGSSVIAQHHQSAWLTDEIAGSKKKRTAG